jgi:hypothetical protein
MIKKGFDLTINILSTTLLAYGTLFLMQALTPQATPDNITRHEEGHFAWYQVLLWIASRSKLFGSEWEIFSRYPILPWLPFTLFGIAYASSVTGYHKLRKARGHAYLNLSLSLLQAACFVILRLRGGFGNTSFNLETSTNPIQRFFSVIKYPPSVAYVFLNLAIIHAALACFEIVHNLMKTESEGSSILPTVSGTVLMASPTDINIPFTPAPHSTRKTLIITMMRGITRPLQVLGMSPLFYYVIHFILYKVMGILIKRVVGGVWFPSSGLEDGVGIGGLMVTWTVGVAIMYWLCVWYGNFKRRQSKDSFWRYF